MNAILNHISKQNSYGVYGLSAALCPLHNLRAIHTVVSNNDIVHFSRRQGGHLIEDDIYNDTTLTVIDENFNVISMAPPIAEKYTLKEVEALPITEETPIMVSELLVGKLVVASLYKNTYMLSTKDSIHGTDPIDASVDKSTQAIFLDLIDRIDPYNGLDGLFRINRGGINCRNFSYTFILSPRGGKFTDNHLDYDIYLVGLYNCNTHLFLNPSQIESMCVQLNSGSDTYKIKQPTYKKVYSVQQLKTALNSFIKTPHVRGLYMLDDSLNAGYLVAKYENKVNLERYLWYLVKAYLLHDHIAVMQMNRRYPKLYPIVRNFFIEYKDAAISMYNEAGKCRTRKAFHEMVSGHKTETALYALYNKNISNFNELHKVFTPNKIIRMMIEEYGFEHFEELIKIQQT